MKKLLPHTFIFFFCLCCSYSLPVFGQTTSSLDYLNRILSQTDMEIQKSIERLSGGEILLTDDPASTAIFERLEGHIRSLAVSMRNMQDLISYYQTKEGYLSGMIDSLQRIRELIIMMSNSIIGPMAQDIIKTEIDHHYDSILKSLQRAEFNTKPLFMGLFDDETITEWFKSPRYYLLSSVDRILSFFISLRSKLGASVNTMELSLEQKGTEKINAEEFESTGDTDFALELSRLKRNRVIFLVNILLLKTR